MPDYPGSLTLYFGTPGDGYGSTFQIQHDSPAASVLVIDELGTMTVYGPIVSNTSPVTLRTTQQTGPIVEFTDTNEAVVAEVRTTSTGVGIMLFDVGGIGVPVNPNVLSPPDNSIAVLRDGGTGAMSVAIGSKTIALQ